MLIIAIIGVVIVGMLLFKALGKKVEVEETGSEIAKEEEKEENAVTLADGSKVNISEELQKTKIVGELIIRNIQLRESGGITTLLAEVENASGSATKEQVLKIEIIDKEGKTITKINGPINGIAAGEKTRLNISITADVSNAYDFKVSK